MRCHPCLPGKTIHLVVTVTLLLTSVPAPVWAMASAALPADWHLIDLPQIQLPLRQTPALAFSSPLPPSGDPVEEPIEPPQTLRAGQVVTGTISSSVETEIVADEVTTIQFAPGAVRKQANVEITRLEKLPAPLPRGVQFKGYGLDVTIHDSVGKEHISKMERPVTIVMRYKGLPGVGNIASQQLLKLYHYDEKRDAWEVLPTTVFPGEGKLVATTNSFSPAALGSDTTTTLGDYAEPWAPTVQDFQVDTFTGASTWAAPIDVPVGRGGLAPSLALSYNSAIIDGMRGKLNPQASWVGAGWNLEQGYIARQIVRDENNTPTAVPTYTLVFNGVSSELVHIGDDMYRTKDERYWRIERLATTGNGNRGGDYWQVTTRDGTQYRFGYQDESAGPDSSYSAWWMVTPVGDTNPDFQYTNWRWNLDRIEDTYGNQMHLKYQVEHNDFVFLWSDGHAHFYTGQSGVRPCGGSYGPCTCNPVVHGETYYNYTCHDYMAGEDYKSGYVTGGYLQQIIYSKDASAQAAPA